MKLVQKLTVALIMGMTVVLAANGYFRVRREVALFRSDRARDHTLVGLAFGAAVSAVWRADGEAQARAMIEQTNAREDKVRFRWLDGGDRDRSATSEPSTQIVEDGRGHSVRRTYVAIAPGDAHAGVLELTESLDAERAYVRTTLLDTAVTTGLLALVSAVLAAGLGAWLVGRPMQSLIAKARRVGRGDFSEPLRFRQRDEIAELADEMNAMCDKLVDANDRAASEAASRLGAIEQLRHADRLMTIGKLASGIAHELGTPLNVIGARATMIAEGGMTSEETIDYVRVIVEACEQMTRIVRQLLEFARPRGPDRATEDVRAIAERTTALLEQIATKRGVSLSVLGEREAFLADVDANQIQQVFTNVIMNAIQATSGVGEVAIAFTRELCVPPPDVGGSAIECITVRIRDEGEGIAPEHVNHVFEPFFTTKDVGSGTGLGLSVAYGIVREHKGWMSVESTLGEGTELRVYLPAKDMA